jgi:hypothetical protein
MVVEGHRNGGYFHMPLQRSFSTLLRRPAPSQCPAPARYRLGFPIRRVIPRHDEPTCYSNRRTSGGALDAAVTRRNCGIEEVAAETLIKRVSVRPCFASHREPSARPSALDSPRSPAVSATDCYLRTTVVPSLAVTCRLQLRKFTPVHGSVRWFFSVQEPARTGFVHSREPA